MKKWILFCSIVFFLTGCSKSSKLQEGYVVSTVSKQTCNNEAELYYSDTKQTVYFVCLDEIFLIDKNGEMTLRDYLEDHDNVDEPMNRLINPLDISDRLFDGGTTIYKDVSGSQYTNDGITIVKCNTLENNRDYYIGKQELNIEEINGYCGGK